MSAYQLSTACGDADDTILAGYLVSTAWYNRYEMAKKLIDMGASPYAKNKDGMQAFRIAKDNGFTKLSDYFRSVSIAEIEHEEALIDSVKSVIEELIDALNNYKVDKSNRERVKIFFTKDNLDRFSGDKEAENSYFKLLTSTVRRISRNQNYILKDDETIELTISSTISSNFELKFKKIDGCFKIIAN